jgi:hypothetical protein
MRFELSVSLSQTQQCRKGRQACVFRAGFQLTTAAYQRSNAVRTFIKGRDHLVLDVSRTIMSEMCDMTWNSYHHVIRSGTVTLLAMTSAFYDVLAYCLAWLTLQT